MTARTLLNVTVIKTLPVLLDCVRVLFRNVLRESIVVRLSYLILDLREDSDKYLFVYLLAISFTVMFMVCTGIVSVNSYKIYVFTS